MILRPRPDDASPKERALWGDLLSLGFVFPLAIVLGFYIGRWAGGKLGFREAGQWVGLVWGIATGFYELYKVARRMERMDSPPPPEGPKPPEDPRG